MDVVRFRESGRGAHVSANTIDLKVIGINAYCPEMGINRVARLVEHNIHIYVDVLVSAHRRRSRGFRAAACLKLNA